MIKRIHRSWFAVFALAAMATFCPAANALMGGIDHLADNLSVTNFWVNGAAGFQAGSGNAGTPSPVLPDKWHPGLMVHVVWHVRDWEHDRGSTYEADVPVEPYTEDGGYVWVHFLANGKVRVLVSNMGPRSPIYPGPHDPIPHKNPWDMYPPRADWRDWNEQLLDDRVIGQLCAEEPDPKTCENQADRKQLDEQRADARRYLPQCARITAKYDYQECETRALQSMAAARRARRCHAVPELPECTARNAPLDGAAASKLRARRNDD